MVKRTDRIIIKEELTHRRKSWINKTCVFISFLIVCAYFESDSTCCIKILSSLNMFILYILVVFCLSVKIIPCNHEETFFLFNNSININISCSRPAIIALIVRSPSGHLD